MVLKWNCTFVNRFGGPYPSAVILRPASSLVYRDIRTHWSDRPISRNSASNSLRIVAPGSLSE